MKQRLFLLFFLFLTQFAVAKPPALTPKDAKNKVDEILKAHVCHQSLTPELTARALQNFIEELDPAKTYLLESDIAQWLNPSPALLSTATKGINNEDFTTFEIIHSTMIAAIERRNAIEKQIEAAPLPSEAQPIEFKELTWAKSEEELIERLLQIKTLQLQTAQKIEMEPQEQFLQRIAKRRMNRETDLTGSSPTERKQLVLSYALKAVSSALDSQTIYFTPAEASQFMIQVQQRLFGIGAQLRDSLSGLSIVSLLDGGPASLSNKLKVGDKIIAVDHEPIVGMDIIEAVQLIRGPQGSNVTLTVLRETKNDGQAKEEKFDFDIVRGEVVLKETRLESYYEPYGDGVIAILHLFSFYQDSKTSSAADLAAAIETIQKDHRVKGIILDLRNNSGGLLPQAVAVTGLFISKGIVVSIKDNTGEIHHLRNLDGKKMWDGPLLVLTNRASASAAEIVAQTLQDYGRAFVIGDQETFGKGTFQTFTLEAANFGKVNPKGEYKVTRGRYYTVSGKSPQLVGVKADIVVPGVLSEMEVGEKFAKYPVETDEIPPNFYDSLTDVPLMHRYRINRIYKEEMQPILSTYQPYLEKLKKNSEMRISQNKNYQNFIKELKAKDDLAGTFDFFGQNDLQLTETLNVMKDFVLFTEQTETEPKMIQKSA